MKIKWLSLVGLIVLIMSVTTYLFVTQLEVDGGWDDKENPAIVMPNKTWTLSFSEEIDDATVNDKSITVMNEDGEKIHAEVSVSDDLRSIVVSPPENGYPISAYILQISKEIKSQFGRSMSTAKEIPFLVKESLPVIGSKESLKDYFQTIIEEEEDQRLFSTAIMESSKESEDSAAGMDNSATQEASETNIQVKGVDESDMVKTNGSHIYQVADGRINIIETNDGVKMKLLEGISYPDTFYPFQIFLHKNKLLVIGHSYEEMGKAEAKISGEGLIAPINDMTKAIVYNISNPSNPQEEKTISLEGHMVSSRKIDNLVYLVTNQYPQYWIMRENEEVDLRPRYSDSSVSEENSVIDYDKIQYFPESKEPNYTMIAAFDLENPSEKAAITTYLGSGDQMYMSKKNLYLAVQNWGAAPLIDKMEESIHTTIYKFAINDLKVEFHSSTEVEGRILNQFSMDEYDGHFRVATTKGMVWDERSPSSNNLFIFDENMKAVSSIEDLARGERIYSARFMGERVYIVTFKETDPLFVIDASNPKEPKVLGELKIPGFSNYLHPLDENHLIGFGYDTKVVTTKNSKEPLILTEGVKLSLFDITDMKNPKEKFTEIIGGRGTYSPLNYDHKALLYDKQRNLFAFPINVYHEVEGKEFEQIFDFQGAYVYNVTSDKGFSLQSKITHMKGKELYEEWENEIQRLVYVGNTLYALSNSKITSYTIGDYQLKGELKLRN